MAMAATAAAAAAEVAPPPAAIDPGESGKEKYEAIVVLFFS